MARKAYSDREIIVKSVVYRLFGTSALIAILILLTQDVRLSLMAGAIEFPVKLAVYFFFEKFWDFMLYRIELWKRYSE